MTERAARCRCRCRQLSATIRGEPVWVSMYHCLDCRQRTGSPFSAQARLVTRDVAINGSFKVWERVSGNASRAFYR